MNYNEFEGVRQLPNENPQLELENYAGKVWEIARKIHQAPQASNLKHNYIAAAKVIGKKRGIHFYRKVIRNAANYLNRALLNGPQEHPGHLVKQAFNRASKIVAKTTAPGIQPPRFSDIAEPVVPAGPYQSSTRGTFGAPYTQGPALRATGRPAVKRGTMQRSAIANGSTSYPAKRGKLWKHGAFNTGGLSMSQDVNRSTSSQNQGRWTKQGNMIILHGLNKNTVYS